MNDNNKSAKSLKNSLMDKIKEQKKSTQIYQKSAGGSFENEINQQARTERLKALEQVERKEIPQKVRQFDRKEFTVFAYTEYREKKIIKEEIRKVRQELYLAISEMEKLGASVKQAQKAVFEEISDPGIYHISFFEKLKTVLKVLRQNIKDSSSWLDLVFARKRRKKYWNMAKKGGSMFTMSHERRMATQAG